MIESEREAARRRLTEKRRRVERRLSEVGAAVEREVERAQKVRDAFVAVLGAVGVLASMRGITRALESSGQGRKRPPRRRGGKKKPAKS